ncbi:MAG: hypothetical protein KDA80_18865 [Planctomycetaceae bacterium]|nr:hypothetical protein [Planctomycetaceae bacterium]
MFTFFHLIQLLAIVGGAALLGAIGWDIFGILGCVVGIPLGFLLGAILGSLPLILGLKWISRRFDRSTDEQLVDELHDPTCLTPNLILLELKRRGTDIQRELPFVLSLLASDDMHRRTAGWAALNPAFPELVGRIPEYRPTATAAECQAKCQPLVEATESG